MKPSPEFSCFKPLAAARRSFCFVAIGVIANSVPIPRAAAQEEVSKAKIPAAVSTVAGCSPTASATDNRRAIQKAIDAAAAKGGGQVVLPAGDFVSGPISLRDRIDLHLAKGCKLMMSQNFDDFPVGPKNRRANFIDGTGLHDVRISGEGVIDGQGDPWWKAYRLTKGSNDRSIPGRPQMIAFANCERVELDGFSTLNPPNTHCSIGSSKDLTITGLNMNSPGDSPNTDALNLNTDENILIANCNISTGDDNIVLLGSGNNDPAHPGIRNVTIRDCKLGLGHGLSVGSYTSAGLQNVHAENITFDGTTAGIRLKAARDRGGLVKGFTYRHMTMNNVRYPISITSYYPKTPPSPAADVPENGKTRLPEWTDILIEDITITHSKNSIAIWGLPEMKVRGITLKRVKAEAEAGAVVFHGDVTFENVEIHPATGPILRMFDAQVKGMDGVVFEGNYKAE